METATDDEAGTGRIHSVELGKGRAGQKCAMVCPALVKRTCSATAVFESVNIHHTSLEHESVELETNLRR